MCVCSRWGRCCKPSDDGSPTWAISVPVVGEVLTGPALSTHTNKRCHGINTSVDRIATQTDRQHTLQRPVCEQLWSNWLFFFALSFWKMTELNEREGGTDPLTSPRETEMSSWNRHLYDEGAAACRLPAGLAAGQCFLFSTRNDRSSLCKRQKGQSLINMCKSPHVHTLAALSSRARRHTNTHRALSES